MDRDSRKILFVFTSIPYPLRADGVSVRYLPILQFMASRHEVDLVVIDGRKEKAILLEGLRPHCRRISHLRHPRREDHGSLAKIRTYLAYLWPWGPPLSVVAHRGSMLTRGLAEATAEERYDSVVWVGGDLLPNLMEALPSMSAGRVCVDFIDSPYLWACRRKEGVFRSGALNRYDRWKTLRWEGDVIDQADGAIYISRVDAGAVPAGRTSLGKRHVVPNGINLPSSTEADPVPLPSPNIGFLGTMGYQPNIEAVLWLHEEVFVPLRRELPGLTFVVIGRFPSETIRELGKRPGVIVTGEVDDIWKYVNGVEVFLFPLFRGAGLKNKILEAMYGGRPVVTTEIGNEGIDAVPGENILLGRNSEDFRRETIQLLGSPEERARLGRAAHAFVKEKFSWDGILPEYEDIVLGRGRHAR